MSTNPWHPDGKGIIDAGQVGGDIQAGPAYEVRFTRDDMPGSLINVRVYAVYWERNREYAIQTQTEFLVCEDPADPGGTEIWSDVDYEDGAYVYPTFGEADRLAREDAEDELRHGAEAQGWDGKPDYGGRS